MDRKILTIFVSVGVAIALLLYFTLSNRSSIADIGKTVNRIESSVTSKSPMIDPRFSDVYATFKLYNPETDSATVNRFLHVVNHFELADNDTVFNWLVGQMCLESGAHQYYPSTDRRAGQVVRGLGGEVGMAQIMPQTAIGYLSNNVSDPQELYDLGASDFSFIDTPKNLRGNTIKWLSDTDNNLILWGLMIRDNMVNHGMLKGLVAYNAGDRGMQRFVKRKAPEEHVYIRNLLDTLDYIADRMGETPDSISVPSEMHVTQTSLH